MREVLKHDGRVQIWTLQKVHGSFLSFAREKWTTYKKELKMYDEEGNVIEAYESEKPFDYKKWAVIICIIVAVVYGLYRLGNSEN